MCILTPEVKWADWCLHHSVDQKTNGFWLVALSHACRDDWSPCMCLPSTAALVLLLMCTWNSVAGPTFSRIYFRKWLPVSLVCHCLCMSKCDLSVGQRKSSYQILYQGTVRIGRQVAAHRCVCVCVCVCVCAPLGLIAEGLRVTHKNTLWVFDPKITNLKALKTHNHSGVTQAQMWYSHTRMLACTYVRAHTHTHTLTGWHQNILIVHLPLK